MKTFVDNLVVAAQPIQEYNLILHILGGLGLDYDALVVSLTARSEPITLTDLHGLLFSHECRLEKMQVVEQNLAQVNLATQNSNNNYFHNGPKNDGSNKKSLNNFHNKNGRGRGRRAINYYHRFDHAYQANSKNQMAALLAQPSFITDPNINVRGEYGGVDQIVVGNGKGLSIKHIGDSILPCFPRPVCLRNVLHILAITKNLLSVAQFTSDNNVYFEFHRRVFLVKDREMGKLLLWGNPEHGLYKL
ncbi:uncharacterized protein LOC124896631 [Capsicum annuum]|uniref:uncharacterized protein LOC124896631 n=1 Tax=Capsicum annuum TaxID=4072 RepID=UPI001FB1767F|nr:uncharacterized protein LOC124896631 [Capsicum annuum]